MYTNGTYQEVEYVVKADTTRRKIYRDLLLHLIGVASCVYQLVTGEKPPKLRDVLSN